MAERVSEWYEGGLRGAYRGGNFSRGHKKEKVVEVVAVVIAVVRIEVWMLATLFVSPNWRQTMT